VAIPKLVSKICKPTRSQKETGLAAWIAFLGSFCFHDILHTFLLLVGFLYIFHLTFAVLLPFLPWFLCCWVFFFLLMEAAFAFVFKALKRNLPF